MRIIGPNFLLAVALGVGTLVTAFEPLCLSECSCRADEPRSDAENELAAEVRGKGWIVFPAHSAEGDWDLFACRPDGSDLRAVTETREWNEFGQQYSRDGRKLMYRRTPRAESIDCFHFGAQGEVVVADPDGRNPRVVGQPGDLPWASWGPDGTQVACLSLKGVSLVNVETLEVVKTMPRKGFFQQLVWSPSGEFVCGVANSFGTGWSIACMSVRDGESAAVNRVDCCTPDWFPRSKDLVFSWRPPGQKENNGQGWTQLWRVDATGANRQLIYGEDGRHVYGGHISPDETYVIFTGFAKEDGGCWQGGAPMGVMRLADGPLIGGASAELRAKHPEAKTGPVLELPKGWEPCWTYREIFSDGKPVNPNDEATGQLDPLKNPRAPAAQQLAQEVGDKGWVAFAAPSQRGDFDLFLMRPDGADRRPLAASPEYSEAGPRFSRDGSRVLYYRIPLAEEVNNNSYGRFELVVARSDGSAVETLGRGFDWASWSPDGAQLACLRPHSIDVIDLATRKTVSSLPRSGIISQLTWSPDGGSFSGTANGLGEYWNIGCLESATKRIVPVGEPDRYNCTSDWMPDADRIVYARGGAPESEDRAELWIARPDGSERQTIYAEADREIYGARPSPDGQYLLFTRSVADLGGVANSGSTLAIIRLAEAPMTAGEAARLKRRLPQAKEGPRLDLGAGWEPDWTFAEIFPGRAAASISTSASR